MHTCVYFLLFVHAKRTRLHDNFASLDAQRTTSAISSIQEQTQIMCTTSHQHADERHEARTRFRSLRDGICACILPWKSLSFGPFISFLPDRIYKPAAAFRASQNSLESESVLAKRPTSSSALPSKFGFLHKSQVLPTLQGSYQNSSSRTTLAKMAYSLRVPSCSKVLP
jgi:hypothetical protein